MEAVAVLVPVLRRPQNVSPLVASLESSGAGGAELYFIADEDDTAEVDAIRAAGMEPLFSDHGSFYAQKINAGYEQTTEPWLFLAADDVRFHRGWLQQARKLFHLFDVIGTNDLGNRAVMAGTHSTHTFVRRSYVDDIGASLDGPGVVLHEGYEHQYCDTEMVAVAKRRQVWSPCLTSVVEHLHPFWGKAAPDDVYRIGQQASRQDSALFKARVGRR